MSTKTSHRRKNARQRRTEARHAVTHNLVLLAPANICYGQCRNMGCEECHDIDNCVAGTERYGDLLLCSDCRAKHPKMQPWRIDPETGEYVDTKTGRYL